MNNILDLFVDADYGGSPYGIASGVFGLLLSFIIGHLVAWTYMGTHKVLSYSQTFVASLVVIPMIVTLVMVLMSGNLYIAFGLLAVFAVVRFRNVLKDTRDAAFIMWTIVEGLAVGTRSYSTAIVGAIGIAMAMVYLRMTAFGSRHRYDAVLTLQLTGDLASGVSQLKGILNRHTLRAQLASDRKLADEGLDLSYRLLLRDPSRSDELQWSLKQTEGIERVSLFMRDDEAEI